MHRRILLSFLIASFCALALLLGPAPSQQPDPLEAAFRNPPKEARPWTYFLLLNGYVNRDYLETELREYADKGIGGLCIFDMGARGDKAGHPPAGPSFLTPPSANDIANVIRTAAKHGMDSDLSVASSWDMGASWVRPEDGSMTLLESEMDVTGPANVDRELPFPVLPAETPRDANGRPLFHRNVAVLAVPDPQRLKGHVFLFEAEKPFPERLVRFVFSNTKSGEAQDAFAKDLLVEVSTSGTDDASFREVLRAELAPKEGPQEFRTGPAAARYIRLTILSGHNPNVSHVQLGEFEAWTEDGRNVLISHQAERERDGGLLLHYSSARTQANAWAASNIHDGVMSGARRSWSSAGPPPLRIPEPSRVLDLTANVSPDGHLRWNAPAGKWKVLRYVVTNTGERLKVPSPNSDGLATDHFNEGATLRYIREVTSRLRPALGDLRASGLKELYLASYEVRGNVWTPSFLDQFEKRRGYSLKPFLPALNGAEIQDPEITARVLFDFRKTQGELLVDAYYRAASRAAREAGLGIESEAGGPGPPIHNVPVDALLANSVMDSVRGEFWPYRPTADGLWVIKETATAAHVYGKRLVAMEAFTSVHHWEEGPQDLKESADRAFCEGMNHVVWHTAAHLPPEAGKPGWVYGAGTHLNPNVPWWPMAKPFLDYLARGSYMLRQGRFVADVLYYQGDGGYKFVPPKRIDPSLGFGYDYDVANTDILLDHTRVEDGRIVLSSGMRYEVLVLPQDEAINLSVLKQVERLVEAGATIIGPKPTRVHGFHDYKVQEEELRKVAARLWGDLDGKSKRSRDVGKGRVIWGVPLREVLIGRGVNPDLRVGEADAERKVDFIHRSLPEAEIYFVRNKTTEQIQMDASFRVSGRIPEQWDAVTASIRDFPQYSVGDRRVDLPIELPPMGSTFVVFRRSAAPGKVAKPPAPEGGSGISVRERVVPANGPWVVRFPSGYGAPERITMAELSPLSEHSDPGVRYFSGVAEYETVVNVPNAFAVPGRSFSLELGDMWAVAEVLVNEENLGVVWARPFTTDVSRAIKPGNNRIRIRVANNWINRLVGEAREDTVSTLTKTNITTNTPQGTPWAKVEPRKSGLFGPVRLIVE